MKFFLRLSLLILILATTSFCSSKEAAESSAENMKWVKTKDIVIYEDFQFYSSFPSVVKSDNNDFIVAFRRAPDRRIFSERGNSHVDPNSYLMMARSADGESWSKDPKLIYSHPLGGSQDPCLLKLKDGTLLCTSYVWTFVRPDGVENLKRPVMNIGGGVVFMGGYLVRSKDDGNNWSEPIYPPHIDEDIYLNVLGEPLPAYNRGALYEGENGRIYWVVAVNDSLPINKTSNHLIVSDDKGLTWGYSGLVATDDNASFNEASIYETPKGDLVAFLRTANMDDQACISRSTDGGRTFKWEKMGFQGHPLNAIRLPDERVLLTYGYRHAPFGIRARILNPECTDFATAPEIVLRNDGSNGDIGYTWPVMLDDKRVLVVYYFNRDNGIRYIAGTILEAY